MDHTQLEVEAVRKLVRCLSYCATSDMPLRDKQEYMLSEFCKILDIDFYAKAYSLYDKQTYSIRVLDSLTNLSGAWQENFIQSTSDKKNADPVYPVIWQQMQESQQPLTELHTFRSGDLLTDEMKNSEFVIRHLEKIGIGSSVYSLKFTDEEHISSVVFVRRDDKPEFSPEEKTLMHIFLNDIPWLYDNKLAASIEQSTALSPRLHETLRYILEGYSNTDIARAMNLSQHTIKDYVKEILYYFTVSSRHELMALFLKR
jgi:DNA-binding CsgD family transcriptional regulator